MTLLEQAAEQPDQPRLPGFDVLDGYGPATSNLSSLTPLVEPPTSTAVPTTAPLTDLRTFDRSASGEPATTARTETSTPDVDDMPSTRSGLPFRVEIRRSARRKRSVSAHLDGDVLVITMPVWVAADEEDYWIDEMSRRYLRRHLSVGIDLVERAATLARRYNLPMARDVHWVDLKGRWGACTPATGTIEVSRYVAVFPPWVLDYVLVHELAHLEVLDHNPAFWKLVARYPRSERAIGFLIAKSDHDS